MGRQQQSSNFAEYRYNSSAGQWVEFPFDQTAHAFILRLKKVGKLDKKLSVQQAESVLATLAIDNHARIHEHIYHNKIRPRDGTTRPFSFFWEVKDLLEAIFVAHCKNPNADTEQLAKSTFEALAEIMSLKTMNDISEYPTAIILSEPEVQHAMIMQFGSDVQKRLDAIRDLTHAPSVNNPGEVTIQTLQTLDKILVNQLDHGGMGLGEQVISSSHNNCSYTQKLEDLYFRLMDIRESLRKDDILNIGKLKETGIHFKLPDSPDNRAIIEKLKELLPKTKKGQSKRFVEEFKSTYLHFISVYAPQDKLITKAQSFFAYYLELERYVHKNSSIADFKEQSREELHRFVKELFSNMENNDLNYTDCFENVFTHAQDAFAYYRLNSIRAEIWSVLHNPLWLLSTEKLIVALALLELPHTHSMRLEENRTQRIEEFGQLISVRVNQLIYRIQQVHIGLHDQFPDMALLRDFEVETVDRFVSRFNAICPRVYGVPPIDVSSIYQVIRAGIGCNAILQANRVMVLEACAVVLKMECQIIALTLIDQAVEKLSMEHNLLQEYH